MGSISDARLVAVFKLDAVNKPVSFKSGGHQHFEIELEVQNLPPDAYGATFELDPSYYDPIRSTRLDKSRQLTTRITSYGDYKVKAILRTKSGEITLVEDLGRALENGHRQSMTPEIENAIAAIKDN